VRVVTYSGAWKDEVRKRDAVKLEEWYTPRQIAIARNVSYDTARRWIMAILGDDIAMGVKKNKGRGKRPWHLRRLPESKLAELDQFVNH
jgi:hypothetical protein